MALSNSHTFVALESVTAANLNGVITNILNNPISLVSPTTGAINFALQSHTNLIPSAISATSGSTGSVLVVSSNGGTVWAPAAPRTLQFIGDTSTGSTITSTTAANMAGQPITPSSTNSRIAVMYSADVSNVGSAGIAQVITLQVVTSSGLIPNTLRSLAQVNITGEGLGAPAAWTFIHQTTGPYPTNYNIQAYAVSATAGGTLGSVTNVNMMLQEWSS